MDDVCVHLSFIPKKVFFENGRSDGKGMNEQAQDDYEQIALLLLDALDDVETDNKAEKSFYRLEAMYLSALRCDAALEIMRKHTRWVIKTPEWNAEEITLLMDTVSDSLWRVVSRIQKAMKQLHEEILEDKQANGCVTADISDAP